MPIVLPEQKKELPVAGCQLPVEETPRLRQPTTKRVRFGPPSESAAVEPVKEKPRRAKKAKCDPSHLAKARELRDRYLEQFNAGQVELLPRGKYDFCRAIAQGPGEARLSLPAPVAA